MSLGTKRNAIVLFSGGLDSTTVLAYAIQSGYRCYALSVDYHQRHQGELLAAENIAKHYPIIAHKIFPLDLTLFGGSALTDLSIDVPKHASQGIPVTYVPARNTLFLSLALAWAEVLPAYDIFIGVNAIDYSGYPDCRPEFIQAFQQLASVATKQGVEGHPVQVHTPLIHKSKAEIIRLGSKLGVDYSLTVSCYALDSNHRACGQCDACRLRREGFIEAGIADPTSYR